MNFKLKNFSWLLYLIIGFLLIGISPLIKLRFDLSEEKKFTISESSIKVLNQLDGPIKVKIYLGGDNLPGGFKRLHHSLVELLEDFKKHSSQDIIIEQIDLYKDYPNEKERQALIFELDSLGIPPTNIVNKEQGKAVSLLVVPGITIEKSDRVIGALLLKGNQLNSPQEILNQSIENLEYEIIQVVHSLENKERKKIGFFLDYSGVPAIKQLDLIASLRKQYDLYPVDLGQSPTLVGLDAFCIIQPNKKFNRLDQFKIDQFLVKGGKGILFLDGTRVDTVQNQGLVFSRIENGLEEMLFHYGLRVNANLVKDAQLCGAIPLEVGNFGNKPSLQLMPWPAFPLLMANPNSVITKNLDAIYAKYPSSIDTISGSNLKKSILLSTSAFTQTQNAPATLPFSASGKDFDPEKYKSGQKAIAYLLEGQFKSMFKNRIAPDDTLSNYFVENSKQNGALIVVGDGDVPLNSIDPNTKGPMALGFDPFSKHTFANKDFILNAFNYLLDDNKSLLARNKNIQLRPLDKSKIENEKSFWQGLNIIVPILFAAILSLLIILYRKYQFSK
ncbi:gliding motility-associated ABC transporter substrate-binding protein GldG [Aquirufa sp. ROCK-SH2]